VIAAVPGADPGIWFDKAPGGGSGGEAPLKLKAFFKNGDAFGAKNLITSMYFRKLFFV
jgi:hypothetical protein